MLELPEGRNVLPPKPEPEGRLLPVVLRGVLRIFVFPGYDLLIVPVLRNAVRFVTAAGGAL